MSSDINKLKQGDNYRNIISFLKQDLINTKREIEEEKINLKKLNVLHRFFHSKKRNTITDSIFALEREARRTGMQISEYVDILNKCMEDKRCL